MTNRFLVGLVAVASFTSGAVMFGDVLDPFRESRTAAAIPEAGCLDQNVLKTVRSLRQEPDAWEASEHTMERGKGMFSWTPYLGIWTSNEATGLDFMLDEDRFGSDTIDYQMSTECQTFLYDEIAKWRSREVSKVF